MGQYPKRIECHSSNQSYEQGDGISSGGADATVELVNAIIAGNSAPNGPDCRESSNGSLMSLGHNLLGDASGCTFERTASDLVDILPMLGSLQDNFGTTLAHALLEGSPAIDSGNDRAAPAADQRGISRPQGAASDIGALEKVN